MRRFRHQAPIRINYSDGCENIVPVEHVSAALTVAAYQRAGGTKARLEPVNPEDELRDEQVCDCDKCEGEQ